MYVAADLAFTPVLLLPHVWNVQVSALLVTTLSVGVCPASQIALYRESIADVSPDSTFP